MGLNQKKAGTGRKYQLPEGMVIQIKMGMSGFLLARGRWLTVANIGMYNDQVEVIQINIRAGKREENNEISFD